MVDRASPAPFLKWAGGKRQLVPRILDLVPARIDTYYEPFLGGAAVFFALARLRLFKRAVLTDANAELVNCYQAVRDDVEGVIAALGKHKNSSGHYYKVRAQNLAKLTAVERAARLIFLNRCGFNGLYRVNSKGAFNVPFGRYLRPTICDPAKLRKASRILQSVDIRRADFGEILEEARPSQRDFVYLDPPYVPLSKTSSFTAYASRDFNLTQQERLAKALVKLAKRKVPALLSNSDCDTTRELYDGLEIAEVQARRAINSNARGRGPVGEILVRSFSYPLRQDRA